MQERSNRGRAKLPSGYVMTPEQERSMHHMEQGTICKCGHKETKVRVFSYFLSVHPLLDAYQIINLDID